MRSPKDQGLVNFVGDQIRAARENSGYTQQQLAEKIGISPQYMSHLENGKYSVPLTLLRNICNVLSVPSDRLIFGDAITKNDASLFVEQMESIDAKYLPPLLESMQADIRMIKAAEQKQSEPQDK